LQFCCHPASHLPFFFVFGIQFERGEVRIAHFVKLGKDVIRYLNKLRLVKVRNCRSKAGDKPVLAACIKYAYEVYFLNSE